jgi:hypothetical protein
MDSTPTKLAIMNSLSPWATAGHHTPSGTNFSGLLGP